MAKVLRMDKAAPETWEDALKQFLWWKQAQGVSDTTLEDYKRHVEYFFHRYPDAYREESLKAAALEYMAQKVKPATFNLRLTYLKVFFGWCVKEGIYAANPLADIKRKKAESRVVSLDADTLKKLLTLPDRKTFAGLRDYALILLTLDTGIRPKEAFSLLPEDVNFRALEVYVRAENAKTRVSRTLPIMPVTANAIRDLLAARHPAWKENVPLFCSAEGTPLNRFVWGDRLEAYSKKLGVKVRPYDLRHCFALEFLRNGGHALALQRTLGHTDLSMTKRYVALTQGDIREQHDMASPLNNLLPQRNRVRKVGK
ncbi:MAG: site-specific integrase [Clostridia bacterium]|nr:MAG: site-specific integrase [Clostridia bacterium]